MKNLFKKIGALLVAAVMVLSMCTAVFAETKTSATITVKNADDATLTYAQVIKADQSTKTGWNFVKHMWMRLVWLMLRLLLRQ